MHFDKVCGGQNPQNFFHIFASTTKKVDHPTHGWFSGGHRGESLKLSGRQQHQRDYDSYQHFR